MKYRPCRSDIQYEVYPEEFDILREITGNARNRVYRADAILEAVSAPIIIEN